MRQTKNVRIVDEIEVPTPAEIAEALPINPRAAELVASTRDQIQAILAWRDPRLIAIVGPCSIHDPEAALDYARHLTELRHEYRKQLLVLMRVYFEKPRTTVGWKGLINDPHLDGTYDIPTGIRTARRLLLELSEIGMPAATEVLDPVVPQYVGDLVSWAAIGARTTESQPHREIASGLSAPVGFKNGTDGGLNSAINAMIACSRPHSFVSINSYGRVSVVRTRGNVHTHLVLRGGNGGPNYHLDQMNAAANALRRANLNPRMLVDCSHDNSGKNYTKQAGVLAELGGQVRHGSPNLLGVMIESNLIAGKQDATRPRHQLTYGQSITDGCVDISTTQQMLAMFAEDIAHRPRTSANSAKVL